MAYNLLAVIGPTACGKTNLAVQLAYQLSGEIVSADSRQVYRELTIGTGKDLHEYVVNNREIPYHLIDTVSVHQDYDVFNFQSDFYRVFQEIQAKNKPVILCGGTGLYLSSILEQYRMQKVDFNSERSKELLAMPLDNLISILKSLRPQLHNTTDSTEKDRAVKAILIAEAEQAAGSPKQLPQIVPLVICLAPPREVVKERITRRLLQRLESGMIEEVEQLLAHGISNERLQYFGLEYRYVGNYLCNIISYQEMVEQLNRAIHNFAKRQMTWLRRMEKHGVQMQWLESVNHETVSRISGQFLKGY